MSASDACLLVALALALDAAVGDPDAIWRRVPHPVAWIGALIAAGDRHLNRENATRRARKLAGVALVAVLLALSVAIGLALQRIVLALPFGILPLALLASVLLAYRSLRDHVRAVESAFATDGLPAARTAVSMIVGRDPERLDEAGVARAAIESAAENFSDGVVAPAFWLALGGLPGLLAYKAINTADSMIGHLSERHRDFGWAAARLDDLVNWPASRLSGLLVGLAAPAVGGRVGVALSAMRREAPTHRSPNAGWPEAAMAGALGLALAGPRTYASGTVDDPFLNPDGRQAATPGDIGQALRVLRWAALAHGALYGGLALLFA